MLAKLLKTSMLSVLVCGSFAAEVPPEIRNFWKSASEDVWKIHSAPIILEIKKNPEQPQFDLGFIDTIGKELCEAATRTKPEWDMCTVEPHHGVIDTKPKDSWETFSQADYQKLFLKNVIAKGSLNWTSGDDSKLTKQVFEKLSKFSITKHKISADSDRYANIVANLKTASFVIKTYSEKLGLARYLQGISRGNLRQRIPEFVQKMNKIGDTFGYFDEARIASNCSIRFCFTKKHQNKLGIEVPAGVTGYLKINGCKVRGWSEHPVELYRYYFQNEPVGYAPKLLFLMCTRPNKARLQMWLEPKYDLELITVAEVGEYTNFHPGMLVSLIADIAEQKMKLDEICRYRKNVKIKEERLNKWIFSFDRIMQTWRKELSSKEPLCKSGYRHIKLKRDEAALPLSCVPIKDLCKSAVCTNCAKLSYFSPSEKASEFDIKFDVCQAIVEKFDAISFRYDEFFVINLVDKILSLAKDGFTATPDILFGLRKICNNPKPWSAQELLDDAIFALRGADRYSYADW
ncbi:MAG: hypothetical protein IJ599_01805 [Alphaproteobacteria bacterium]|nr:hypothetical protein [Alphaproteobacteria bacterium]